MKGLNVRSDIGRDYRARTVHLRTPLSQVTVPQEAEQDVALSSGILSSYCQSFSHTEAKTLMTNWLPIQEAACPEVMHVRKRDHRNLAKCAFF